MKKKATIGTIQYAFHVNASNYGILLAKSTLDREFSLHRHDFYEFEIVVSGEVTHSLIGWEERLVRGDFHCLGPDTPHSVIAERREGMIYNISVFLPDAPPALRAAVESFTFPCHGHLPEEVLQRLEGLYDILFLDARAHVPYEEEKVSSLAVYILKVLAEYAAFFDGGATAAHRQPHVQAALAIVRERYATDLTLSDVAAMLGLSTGYLSSLFTKELGIGFKDYLSAVRVRHAMRLLASTDDGVTEIALASGFGSFSSFERAFGRIAGMTPRDYRRHAATGLRIEQGTRTLDAT